VLLVASIRWGAVGPLLLISLVIMGSPGPATISLLAAPSATTDCSATGSNCTVLADYDRARDGAANQSITLRGRGVDLITFISSTSHSMNLQLQASGTGPSGAWNADVSMDMGLKARANFP